MNSTQKKLGLMAAMYAMAAMGPNVLDISTPEKQEYKDQGYKRKKCKSCSLFPCKPYQKPLSMACEKYNKKK